MMNVDELDAFRTYRNAHNPFAMLLGISVNSLEIGRAEGSMRIMPEYMNPLNIVHGGCAFALADVCASYAVLSYGSPAVTSAVDLHYLSAARQDDLYLRGEAEVTHRGRKLSVSNVCIYACGETEERLIAMGTITHCSVEKVS